MNIKCGRFTLKGKFSIEEEDGKTTDCEVDIETDGTMKQENGEAWLKLIRMEESKACGIIREL